MDATRCSSWEQVRLMMNVCSTVWILNYFFFPSLDQGTVQKVIVLPKDPTTMEELTLEEVEVFRVGTRIKILHQNTFLC